MPKTYHTTVRGLESLPCFAKPVVLVEAQGNFTRCKVTLFGTGENAYAFEFGCGTFLTSDEFMRNMDIADCELPDPKATRVENFDFDMFGSWEGQQQQRFEWCDIALSGDTPVTVTAPDSPPLSPFATADLLYWHRDVEPHERKIRENVERELARQRRADSDDEA